MSYKRVIEKKGKSYGPYIYQSYRDKDGNVKKRYLGKVKNTERKASDYLVFIYIFFGIFFLLIVVGYSTSFSAKESAEKFMVYPAKTING
ncbi:MAG: hypothetical protein Q8N88_04920, partial [Nanoarchaeota archaeon]|nr:hypothetical protein [Nanoarchaeota archaeon]